MKKLIAICACMLLMAGCSTASETKKTEEVPKEKIENQVIDSNAEKEKQKEDVGSKDEKENNDSNDSKASAPKQTEKEKMNQTLTLDTGSKETKKEEPVKKPVEKPAVPQKIAFFAISAAF